MILWPVLAVLLILTPIFGLVGGFIWLAGSLYVHAELLGRPSLNADKLGESFIMVVKSLCTLFGSMIWLVLLVIFRHFAR